MNVLAIGAHFDDIEIGCGGSLARHATLGDTVYAYVATNSGYIAPSGTEIRSSSDAISEGKIAIELLGANLIIGSFDTFQVDFSEDLNAEIIGILEGKKIQRVYTHWQDDPHHDHYVLSKSTRHCCRHIPELLMYKSNWHNGTDAFHAAYFIDISKFIDIKMNALRAHKSEIGRTNGVWLEYFKNQARNYGFQIGTEYAEGFQIVQMLEK